jgi:hypothetical protein
MVIRPTGTYACAFERKILGHQETMTALGESKQMMN